MPAALYAIIAYFAAGAVLTLGATAWVMLAVTMLARSRTTS